MSEAHPFHGSLVALPTPFRGGSIDFETLRALVERQIASGTDGIVVGGSTGEAGTLTTRERESLFTYTAGVAGGRLPVIAGVGAQSTHEACALAEAAERAGTDGLLATTPAYSRPTQEGLRRHFGALATATRLPIALYNIPARTAVDLVPETVAGLAEQHANVVAIKEASDSLERLRILVSDTPVAVLCGEDRWIADAMELGARGVVGVVSNLVPRAIVRLVRCFQVGGDPGAAPAIVEDVAPLVRMLSFETNPAPLKAALELLDLAPGELRLPLVAVTDETRARIRELVGSSTLLAAER